MPLAKFVHQYKTVIFDMDGVITSEQNYWNSAALTVYEFLHSSDFFGSETLCAKECMKNVSAIRREVSVSYTHLEGITQGLEHTLAQIAIASDGIPFQRNKDLLFHIFYFGLPHMQGQILERKKTNHEKSIRSFRGERERK